MKLIKYMFFYTPKLYKLNDYLKGFELEILFIVNVYDLVER
jgi:hypothetical protein